MTMRMCPKCGERNVLERDPRWCRECRNAYHRGWHWKHQVKSVLGMKRRREEDPERFKNYSRAYNGKYPNRRREQSRLSKQRHALEIKIKSHENYWADPESARRYAREWRLKHIDEVRRRQRELHQMNKERRNAESRRWKKSRFFYERARKWEKRYGCPMSPLTLWGIWKKQRGVCALTGRTLDGRRIRGAAIDHIVARSNGGTGNSNNLRWLCHEANSAKGTLTDNELFRLCEDILIHKAGQHDEETDIVLGVPDWAMR